MIEEQYELEKIKLNAQDWSEYDIPGGKVCVSPDGFEALVMSDGRYPSKEEGYQINDFITETETTLWGVAIIELPDSNELIAAPVGTTISFQPKKRFSVAGKCVSHVQMDQKWDGSQKHYVK